MRLKKDDGVVGVPVSGEKGTKWNMQAEGGMLRCHWSRYIHGG